LREIFKNQIKIGLLGGRVSEEVTKLMDVIQRLERLKIEELRNVVERMRQIAIEMKSYADKDASSFVIGNEFKLTGLKIEGKYSRLWYFGMSADPEKTTINDVFTSFFNDTATFHNVSLRYIADMLDDLAGIIETALAKKDDP
jgi:hypothetical protein